jgi:two-component system, OmpR family, sensor histidine kinase CiaH
MTSPSAGPSVRRLSIRVALAATAIVGVAYLVIAAAVAIVITDNLTAEVDGHLQQALVQMSDGGGQGPGGPPLDHNPFDPTKQDPRGLPVLVWHVGADGAVAAQGLTNLELPVADANVGSPTSVTIDGATYRLAGASAAAGRVVVGQSMDTVAATQSTLVVAEVGIGFALLVAVFLGAVAIGRRVALPIERERRRQLEFTADASHELRTPLSVIEAQTSLALARDREPPWDQSAFLRIDKELKRTRRLVDDMLWLARFDSAAPSGGEAAEPVDLAVLANQTADRFGAVAEAKHQRLEVRVGSTSDAAIVTVSPEWLDRLLGVLLDNACKYSPEGGNITVSVVPEGRRLRLAVEDSGPGIPAEERSRVFDRFHRATDAPGGAGLGLAIADAIVRASGGRWSIGTSEAGGASIAVTWARSAVGDGGRRESHPGE